MFLLLLVCLHFARICLYFFVFSYICLGNQSQGSILVRAQGALSQVSIQIA